MLPSWKQIHQHLLRNVRNTSIRNGSFNPLTMTSGITCRLILITPRTLVGNALYTKIVAVINVQGYTRAIIAITPRQRKTISGNTEGFTPEKNRTNVTCVRNHSHGGTLSRNTRNFTPVRDRTNVTCVTKHL